MPEDENIDREGEKDWKKENIYDKLSMTVESFAEINATEMGIPKDEALRDCKSLIEIGKKRERQRIIEMLEDEKSYRENRVESYLKTIRNKVEMLRDGDDRVDIEEIMEYVEMVDLEKAEVSVLEDFIQKLTESDDFEVRQDD